jgi:hypothetical protein
LLLRGEHIVLDQRSNLMTIPGPGEMHTKARSLPGEQRGGQRSVPAMVIIWKNSLEFDGLVAQFHGHVRVNGSSTFEDGDVAAFRIDGQEMRAELTGRLSFVDPPDENAVGNVDLATLTFPDDVVLQNRTTNRAGELESTEQMDVKTLVLDQRTGDLTARGPGQLSSVRRGMPAPAPGRSAQSELMNVQVHYQNAIQGNLVQREIEFQGRVHALYGPVKNWNERLDRDSGPIGSDAFHLHSETLRLTEMPAADARSKPHHEILATQAVEVHGESFDAFGETLHYDASKALLILNGTEREPARIDSDWENGRAKAKSIRIWHKDQRVKLENIQQFQIGPFSNRPGVQR